MGRHSKGNKRKEVISRRFVLPFLILVLVAAGATYGWIGLSNHSANQHSKLNVLILGTDRDKGRSGRSDTLLVLHVDFPKKKIYLVSIPRDARVDIPGIGPDKINAAYALGGPALSLRTVEALTGLNLDHYVRVDLRGFKKMVDALGGIDINVSETINSRTRGYTMYIPRGMTHMKGDMALNYVRYRHGDDDFRRTERQQNFFRALIANSLRLRSVWKIPRLTKILYDNVDTDLSLSEASQLAYLLRSLKESDFDAITSPGDTGMLRGISYVVLDKAILGEIIHIIERGGSLEELKDRLRREDFN